MGEGKRVLCPACKEPIKLDDLGGIISDGKGGIKIFHKNIFCTMFLVDEIEIAEKEEGAKQK